MLRKTILELISKGYDRYVLIEKKAVATCAPFITTNTFRAQFYRYLLANGYIVKVSRGTYNITEKGEKLLAILS
jgi:hypothetical protein